MPNAVRAAIQVVNMRAYGVLSDAEWEEIRKMPSHVSDIQACGGNRWSNFVLLSMGILQYSSANEKFTLEDAQQIFATVRNMAASTSRFSPLTELPDTLQLAHAHSADFRPAWPGPGSVCGLLEPFLQPECLHCYG